MVKKTILFATFKLVCYKIIATLNKLKNPP